MNDASPKSAVRHIETMWIPMSDGTRLAARAWMPEDAERKPVPAILEYIPYRRRDGTRDWDDLSHPYLAAHGYVCVRLDIRGTGDSEGVMLDEYLKQEQDDAVEAIAWLAKQPWCNGNVGMMGISWGGFNSLQVAARRPPALKAIITYCSTDDRYADDMHYMGGAHLTGNLEWGSTYFAIMGRAPDPLIVGEAWRKMWLQRLEAMTPVFGTWLKHQRRDEFWKHGSVGEDIDQIQAAVMAVGGWADGYTNTVFRLLKTLKSPKQGIVGPWGHKYGHVGVPGPAIGYLTESLRWWDHWLKGIDTGIMKEPQLRAYVQDSVAPASHYDARPGRWVAEPSWPSASIAPQTLHLNDAGLRQNGTLGREAGKPAALAICSPQTTGSAGGEWCPYGLGGLGPELPLDQRGDDANSLVFDGAPLAAPLEILGAPVVELELASDQPVATAVVRLSDVAPDGRVTRVTYGLLNLTHRDSHADPKPLEPGKRYRIRIQLNDIGHRFAVGHRVRVAISTAYWPILWPAPKAATLALTTGSSTLSLPVRQPQASDAKVRFGPPEPLPPGNRTLLRPGDVYRKVTQDVATGALSIHVLRDDGCSTHNETGVTTEMVKNLRYRMHPDDPATAYAEADHDLVHRHVQGWDTRIKTHCAIACSPTEFIVEADLQAFEGELRIFSRSWTQRIPRDLM
ncbi:peptidase S15 [Hypericibacter terrae]|uniref:Peptidase S15 n=1 Tax=Hypericibacter terrae TaxID=2602015 RepID=A0A5J6MCC2_9PROT|nr:CocE/NonD family hydrolase [Hypericibacter terrae]QEX14989.1 peptidase S15 [Hypericibacter terrae]